MIKKLRNRFVRLSMVLISIVLILFFLMMTGIVYNEINTGVQNTLKYYSSENLFNRFFVLGKTVDDATSYAIDPATICVVGVNEYNEISMLDSGGGVMDADVLGFSVDYAMQNDSEFGIVPRYRLLYYKNRIGPGYRIAFADSTRYFVNLKDMLFAAGVLFLATLLVLYIIYRQMAKIFIKPVEKAWTQQQNFIADASHELKTPLTVILANCDILLSHPTQTVDDQIKWVESTNEEASHMKELVNKMLFLAKNEAMRPQQIYDMLNLSDLVTKVMLQFEPVAFEAGVEIASQIEPDIEIRADGTAVNQIIHILVDNAVKYAGIGGNVQVTLKKTKTHVILSTHNSGAPIPAEDLPHIFERFYRSDKARTSGSGYGLGLAICKSLAEQQHADISVASDTEHGTEFTVRFSKPRGRKKVSEK